MPPMTVVLRSALLLTAVTLAACGRETRTLAADQPQTPPNDAGDPRIARYQENAYQLSQGGRYFAWYGCARCHAHDAPGALTLESARRRHGDGFDDVYRYVASDHPGIDGGYASRIPVEQLWQITAYVRALPTQDEGQRRRQDADVAGEPQGNRWAGPVR